jgi:glycerophosphoryl diester phosphodiesterase
LHIKLRKDGDVKTGELVLISHRGGKGFGPENTLESLARALEYGVEMVETDVRISRDGVPLIHHSPFIGLHLLSHLYMAEIREKAPQIPTLEEYIYMAGKRCAINLEIKRCEPSILAEIIGWAKPDFPVLVSSFDGDFIRQFMQHESCAACGLITQYELSSNRAVEEAMACGAKTLLPVFYSVTEDLVNAAHEEGIKVFTWTVNTDSKARDMIIAGVDGLITDSYRELEEWLQTQTESYVAAGQALLGDSSILP